MSEGERGVRCGHMSGLSVRLPFGSARGRNGFAPDSPLEGDGFEPLVPQREGIGHFETTLIDPWPLHLREKHLPRRRDLEFAFGLLLRGICEPAQHEGSSRSSTRWL